MTIPLRVRAPVGVACIIELEKTVDPSTRDSVKVDGFFKKS